MGWLCRRRHHICRTLDGRYFEGPVDELAYYPLVLSAAQIQAHYEAGVVVNAVPTLQVEQVVEVALLLGLLGLAALRRRSATQPRRP